MGKDKSSLFKPIPHKITIKPMDTPEQREQLVKDVVEALRGKNTRRGTDRTEG